MGKRKAPVSAFFSLITSGLGTDLTTMGRGRGDVMQIRLDTMTTWGFIRLAVFATVLFGIALGVGLHSPERTMCKFGTQNKDVANTTKMVLDLEFAYRYQWFFVVLKSGQKDQDVGKKIVVKMKTIAKKWTRIRKNPWLPEEIRLKKEGKTHYFKKLGPASVHNRTIWCAKGYYYCDEIAVVFQQPVVPGKYKIEAEFVPEKNDRTLQYIDSFQFKVTYPSRAFMTFQYWWTYVFVFISFLTLICFLCAMCTTKWRLWTYNQQWLMALTIGLVLNNNPLYYWSTLSRVGWIIIFVGIIFQVMFISLLLLFWLCSLGLLLHDEDEYGWAMPFLCPKVCAVFPIFICALVSFAWVSLRNKLNPLNAATDDFADDSTFPTFVGIVITCTVLYSLYLLLLVARAFSALWQMRNRDKGFFVITFPVLIYNLVAICMGMTGFSFKDTGAYLAFYALQNIYILVLVYLYTPTSVKTGIQELPTVEDGAGTSI